MQQPTLQFAYRLCLELGIEHPDYLLNRLSSRQLAGWIAYYNWHPFGVHVRENLLAQLCALIYNANKGKGGRAMTSSDFLPQRKSDWQTPDQMRAILRRFARGSRKDNRSRD